MTPPAWNNLEQVTGIHRFFEIGGIVALAVLVLFETIACIYGAEKKRSLVLSTIS